MNEIHIAVGMMFTSDQPATDDQFEAFLDEVVRQLNNIDRDVILAARLSDRFAEFATEIEAHDFATASTAFMNDLRTALHAAGCITADWPRFVAGDYSIRELQDA